ncbi:isocitrate/isopropylmalate dehydrogenase family protein, partial [Patescibacteria group bacterium]|nr:isocitrate/isopropylmalate dehydrogenase family protein [Patescibacteria group bacterium]
APDISGTGRANPTAMFLSAAMMLEWLGSRHDRPALTDAACRLEQAVEEGFSAGEIRPMEFGGPHGTKEVTQAVIQRIHR